MSETGFFFYQDWDRKFWQISLDIETGINTIRIAVSILRLLSRLSGLQSWYQDWYWDLKDCRLDIKTGIKTFRIAVLISRLVLRRFFFIFQTPKQDWYWDCQNMNSLIKTLFDSLSWHYNKDYDNSWSLTNTGIRMWLGLYLLPKINPYTSLLY